MARSNQTGGRLGGVDHAMATSADGTERGSARPRVPVSMANSPPASRWPGALGRDPPLPIEVTNSVASPGAAEGGHGRLLDRQARCAGRSRRPG